MKDGSLEHLDIVVSDLQRSGEFWSAFLSELGYHEYAKSATGWSWTNDESTVFLLAAERGYLEPSYHRKRVGLIIGISAAVTILLIALVGRDHEAAAPGGCIDILSGQSNCR